MAVDLRCLHDVHVLSGDPPIFFSIIVIGLILILWFTFKGVF